MMRGLGGGRGTLFWGEMGLVLDAADGSSFRSLNLRLRLSWSWGAHMSNILMTLY